jgi:hypothetical protein
VLKRHSEQILKCNQRAAECSDKADAAGTAEIRTFWLDQATKWVEFARQLDLPGRSPISQKSVNINKGRFRARSGVAASMPLSRCTIASAAP